MKKIDIFMSDVLLKVNVTELKMIKILDLKYEIDFESTENHVKYFESVCLYRLKTRMHHYKKRASALEIASRN